jgi:ectoine hydroxylase-related dioxygenase (phytanoyl-CoA dioxygenase family)
MFLSKTSMADPNLNWLMAVHDQGFAIIPGLLALVDLDPLIAELSEPELPRSRAGVRHAMRFPCVRALARDERLLGMARRVLGNSALPFKATMFDKSPTANWLVAWHQDTALPLKQQCDIPEWGPWSVKDGVTYAHAPASALGKILALRVHLDDSTLENGPLRVLPGTHELGVMTDNAIHELSTKIQPVECPVAQGGVLAMRPLIVHASSKSLVDYPRRVLHIEYAETVEIAEGLELADA